MDLRVLIQQNTRSTAMHTNKDYNRLAASKDIWKTRAGDYNSKARRETQRAGYHSRCHETLLKEIIALNKEVDELKQLLNDNSRKPIQIISKPVLHLLCFQLIINVHVSFRSIPKILAIICQQFGLLSEIPCYTTIIEWILRIGLAGVKMAGKIAEPWIGIMDFSVQSGKEKVLVVLRLPLS